MKIKSYKLLFRIFSYLSDRTDGAQFFVKYKLMLGSMIIGLTGSAAELKAQNNAENDTVPIVVARPRVTCYKPAIITIPHTNALRKIEGTVVDPDEVPLVGATVSIKDQKEGVVCDIDGNFTIEAKPSDTLVFMYLGMVTKEIAAWVLRDKGNLIKMEENHSEISCYIVVLPYKFKEPKKTKIIYDEADEYPFSPVGGRDEFQDWIENNIRYTEQMLADKTEGQLLLSFTIDKKGKIKGAKVISKLSPDADAEALRVLTLSGDWKPAMHNGKPIETMITIPVRFSPPVR